MAFFGLMIMWILLLIFIGIVIFTIVTLIIGLIIKKKHKKVSNVLFVLSGIGMLTIVGVLLYVLIPRPEVIETPTGEVEIKKSCIENYKEYMEARDLDGLRELLDEYPELIYYQDVNRVTLLEYGMYNTDIEIMQLAIEYGAVFDDHLVYSHLTFENSFDSFFSRLGYPKNKKEKLYEEGVVTEDICVTVEFMIENGASLEYSGIENHQYANFYEEACDWSGKDNVYGKWDSELLNIIRKNMED